MRKLSTWLEIPFLDRQISTAEMSAFTTDHLQRLIANNGSNQWTTRITATSAANQVFEQEFSADLTKLGVRKASKLAKDLFRKGVSDKLAYFDAKLTGQYGAAAPVHVECFPQGRTVFTKCPDDMLEKHLDALIAGLTAHQADLGAALVQEATDFQTAWLAVYDASEGASGAKTSTQESKNAAKAALAKELFLNLLAIAAQYPGEPDQLALFMQQSLLENKTQSAADQPQPAPQPPPPAP